MSKAGSITLKDNGTLDMSNLETVGDLTMSYWTNALTFSKLTSITGDMNLTGTNSITAPALTSITGNVSLSGPWNYLEARSLKSIGGNVTIPSGTGMVVTGGVSVKGSKTIGEAWQFQ